jgi:hypothetical protein
MKYSKEYVQYLEDRNKALEAELSVLRDAEARSDLEGVICRYEGTTTSSWYGDSEPDKVKTIIERRVKKVERKKNGDITLHLGKKI